MSAGPKKHSRDPLAAADRPGEYSFVRRARRDTKPTPVQGVRTQTAELRCAVAAALLLDAIRAAGMDGEVREEVLVEVRVQLTPDEAHRLAAALLAGIPR